MQHREMKNAPPLMGWVLATAAGAVAFGVSLLYMGLDGNQSVAIGAVVLLIVGTVSTIAESPLPERGAVARDAAAATPVAAPPAPTVSAAATEGTRPPGLTEPMGGVADDLKQITGVGPVLEGKLNALGIHHFSQIAAWTDAEVAWVEEQLDFKGRIGRDDWIAQARNLASAGSGSA